MAIAFDVASASTADLASGANHSHAGGGSARAVIVCIAGAASSTPSATAVTYGGVNLARVQSNSDTSESGNTDIWWKDNIPTGTQNVVVTHSGQIRIAVYTVTVGAGMAAALDAVAGQDTTTSSNPAWNMATTASTTTFCAEVINSGLQTMTTTPATNWTAATTTGLDRGAQGWGSARRNPLPTGGTVACGWTAATSDDWCGSSIALKEVAAATPVDGAVLDLVYDMRAEVSGGVLDFQWNTIAEVNSPVLDLVSNLYAEVNGGVLDLVSDLRTEVNGDVLDLVSDLRAAVDGSVLDLVSDLAAEVNGGVLDLVSDLVAEVNGSPLDLVWDLETEVEFSPADIAGMQVWFEVNTIEGLNYGDTVPVWEKADEDPIDVTASMTNPTFESSTSGWTNFGSITSMTQSTEEAHSGTGSLKLVNANAGEDDFARQTGVPVTAGDAYRVSAWCKTTDFDAPAVGNRGILIFSSPAAGVTTLAADTGGAWVKHTAVVAAQGSTMELRLYAPQGTTYWDDVTIERLPRAAVATGAPTYADMGSAGPAVRFDGVDDKMETGPFTWNQPSTIFAIARFREPYASLKRAVIDGVGSSGSSRRYLYRHSATEMALFAGGGGSGLTVTTTPEQWHVYAGTFDGESSTLQIDDGAPVTGGPGALGSSGLRMGNSTAATDFGPVDILAVIGYNSVLSSTDIDSVIDYLQTQFPLPTQVDADALDVKWDTYAHADIVEQVTNPGFEVDLTGWSAGSGGSFWMNGSGTITRTTSEAHSGAASAQVTNNGVAASGAQYQRLHAMWIGSTYVAEVWMKGAAGGESVRMLLGSNGNQGMSQQDVTLTTSWQKFTLTHVRGSPNLATGGTAYPVLQLKATNATSITWYVDDVSVKGNPLDLVWNTKSLVDGDTRTLLWNLVAAMSGNPSTLKWDLLAAINGNASTLKWDLRAAADALALDLIWDTRAEVDGAILDLLWNTSNTVNSTLLRFVYDLRSLVDGPVLDLPWDTYVTVNGTSLDLVWDLRSETTGAVLDFIWDLRSQVAAGALDLNWDLRAQVTADQLDLLWDLASEAPALIDFPGPLGLTLDPVVYELTVNNVQLQLIVDDVPAKALEVDDVEAKALTVNEAPAKALTVNQPPVKSLTVDDVDNDLDLDE